MVQVYLETAQQAGFDGPYLIELTIMLLLSKVYPCLGASPAYRRYFHDLRGSDLARARQLTEDPYMLIKFKVPIHPDCFTLRYSVLLLSYASVQLLFAVKVVLSSGRRLACVLLC